MTIFLRRAVALLAVSLSSLAAPAAGAAQTASAAELQAAFVVNFIRFTTWPPLPDGHPTVVCVVDDARIAQALRRTARALSPSERPLSVVEIDTPTAIDGCQALFIGRSAARAGAIALDRARQRPILTVAGLRGFARGPGIIELFVEGDRMRFAINAENAERAGLRLSARLLGLAKAVYGTAYD